MLESTIRNPQESAYFLVDFFFRIRIQILLQKLYLLPSLLKQLHLLLSSTHLRCLNLTILHDYNCFDVILDSKLLNVLEARTGKYAKNLDCDRFVAGLNPSKQVNEVLNHGKATDVLNQPNVFLPSETILNANKMLLTHERLYELACWKFSHRGRRNSRDK